MKSRPKSSTSTRPTTAGLTSRASTPAPSDRADIVWGRDDFQWSDLLEQFLKENAGTKGEVVKQHVWTDIQDTLARLYIGQLKEVKQMMEAQHKPIEDKLDKILFKMRNLDGENGLSINCKDLDLQKVNEEVAEMGQQILSITNRVHASMEADEEARGRVHEQMEKIKSNGEDLQTAVEKIHQEQLQQGSELSSRIQEQMHDRLDQPVVVDFKPVMGKLSKNHCFLEDDFKVIASELSSIKQCIHLDYVRTGSTTSRSKPRASRAASRAPSPAASWQPAHEAKVMEAPATLALKDVADEATDGKDVDVGMQEDSVEGEAEPYSQLYTHAIRYREHWAQTDAKQTVGGWAQTDPPERKPKKARKSAAPKEKARPQAPKLSSPFRDADSIKAKARSTLIVPQYNVVNFYKQAGCFSNLAKSHWFENVTLCIVTLNTFWIAIDIDNNTAAVITDAPAIFQIIENLFCAYFFFEVFIRFNAFAQKLDAFKDLWFTFDFILVTNMVVETWIIPIVIVAAGIKDLGNTIDLTMLRMFRMVKLLRLSRMAKFLRSFPELVFVMKAMFYGARSMVVFFLIWIVIVYGFAVIFRQLTAGEEIGEKYFSSVPAGMMTLLFDGVLADYAPLMNEISNANPLLTPVIVFFVLLASVTVMYMLIGVLVEAVDTTVKTEKENMTVEFVASDLRETLLNLGYPVEKPMSLKNFRLLILEEDIIRILQNIHVDVIVLYETLDVIYEDLERDGMDMDFEKMVSVILDMRGSNAATVKDSQEQIRVLKTIIKQSFEEISKHISNEFTLSHSLMEGFQKTRYDESDDEGEEEQEEPRTSVSQIKTTP